MSSNYVIRRAFYTDLKNIEKLVRDEWLNYFGLDWSNFLVAEKEGNIIACGQLQSYGNINKLGSLIVKCNCRKQGVATRLAKSLIEQSSKPIYISCKSELKSFYNQLDFRQIDWFQLPPQLKLEFALYHKAAFIRGKRLVFMEYNYSSLPKK